MYDEQVRTFCFIKPPKNLNPKIFKDPISHIDIVATILDLLNLPSPSTFQGISIYAKNKREHIYMYTRSLVGQIGIIQWPWKLLVTYYPRKGMELYNLEQDKDEKKNLFGISLYGAKAKELYKKLGLV